MESIRNIPYILLLLVSTAVAAAAGASDGDKVLFESLRIGNTVVTNVRVTDSTPTHVTVMYDGGGSRLKRQDLPPALKSLYPYDPKEVAEYEKQQAADKEQRAAEERARQDRFNRELKASLQRQQPVVKARLEELHKDLNQLEKEMVPMKGKAAGKPKSPARAELDAARDRKLDLTRRIGQQKNLLERINKQLDALP